MKYSILILCLIIISCKTQDFTQIYPDGNMQEINSKNDDIAPVDQPNFTQKDSISARPFLKEIKRESEEINIRSSADISDENMNFDVMNEKWRKYLTSNVESISFLSKNSGVISFSHPLHPDFADAVNINITKQSGGTDLYEFYLDPEKGYEFLNLEPLSDINTEYWESHPFIADTLINGEKVKILLWASDSHAPYSEYLFKDGNKKTAGNIDIYYAFYKNNNWTEKKQLTGINTDKNEVTPFIYCLCQAPSYLFYSSNNNANNEYDIIYNKINIDYKNEIIEVVSDKKTLEKLNNSPNNNSTDEKVDFDKNYVNTYYDERYPYIPTPYGDSLFIYYSSEMFRDSLQLNDTLQYITKGGFDIYKKSLDKKEFECAPKPIQIKYEVAVLDAENPERKVNEPFVNIENAELINNNGNKFIYELNPDSEYIVTGGSDYKFRGFDCKAESKGILSEYAEPKLDYDLGDWITTIDTENEDVRIKNIKNKIITSERDTVELIDGFETEVYYLENISYLPTQDKSIYTKQKLINKRYQKINSAKYIKETTFNSSDNFNKISKSDLSLNGSIKTANIKASTVIKDTIWLSPVYQDPYEINLRVFVLDACNNNRVKQPALRLVSEDKSIDSLIKFSGKYFDLNLQCGQKYEIYGGSFANIIKSEAFPKSKQISYLNPYTLDLTNGKDIPSKRTENGGIIIDEITEDLKLTDTVFVLKKESSLYTVNLLDGKERNNILDPLIKIKNISKNKEIIIENDFYKFYPNPEDKYEIYGGSNNKGNECIDGWDHIVLSYKKPIFNRNFKTYFNDDNSYKNDISKLTKIDEAEVFSKYSQRGITRFYSERCENKTFNDTIYLIPEIYLKPPCRIEFTEFEGFNRNVPYFQTGFWEVNTEDKFSSQLSRLEEGFEISDTKIKRNRSDYRIQNSDEGLYPKFDDNYEYSIANARWIELHPNNKYWGWRYDLYKGESKERIENRKRRIKEYKEYSKQVSDNLDLMAEKIKNNVLPIFKSIEENTPDKYGTKLLIEIIALSDQRDVERGWYIGDSNITYKSAKYDSYSNNLIKNNIFIEKPKINKEKKLVTSRTDLKKNNKTLSDLRAWFGYKEISKRIIDFPYLAKALRNNEILLPDNSNYSTKEIEKAKVIFAVSGQKIDEYSSSRINNYKRQNKSSYFVYDTTRRVEVVIRLVNYQNGKIYISDCCNEDLEFISSYKDANARKED